MIVELNMTLITGKERKGRAAKNRIDTPPQRYSIKADTQSKRSSFKNLLELITRPHEREVIMIHKWSGVELIPATGKKIIDFEIESAEGRMHMGHVKVQDGSSANRWNWKAIYMGEGRWDIRGENVFVGGKLIPDTKTFPFSQDPKSQYGNKAVSRHAAKRVAGNEGTRERRDTGDSFNRACT